jgi:phosphopantothenoylcysteine synthetase/decarboxylase
MKSAHTNQIPPTRVLYVAVCAAPPATSIHEFVSAAQAVGWEVCTVVTREASKFVDVSQLESLTMRPVRSEYRSPGEQDPWPGPDAIATVPATFNTINKWALGIADTLVVGMLCEHMGRGIPIVVVPCLKAELAAHPAFDANMRLLQSCGVRFIYDPATYPAPAIPPATLILRELTSVLRGPSGASR